MSTQLWWHVARSSGLVAWAVAAASVVWGLALSGKALGKRPAAGWLLDLHRFFGGLSVTFSAVHVAALMLDSYVTFTIADVLVPFSADWHAGAVAWGIVAMYLLVAVEVTSLLRRRLPVRWWRRVHLLSFVLYLTATAHLLTAGSDAQNPAMLVMVGLSVVLVVFLGLYRVLVPRRRRRRDGRATSPVRQSVMPTASGTRAVRDAPQTLARSASPGSSGPWTS